MPHSFTALGSQSLLSRFRGWEKGNCWVSACSRSDGDGGAPEAQFGHKFLLDYIKSKKTTHPGASFPSGHFASTTEPAELCFLLRALFTGIKKCPGGERERRGPDCFKRGKKGRKRNHSQMEKETPITLHLFSLHLRNTPANSDQIYHHHQKPPERSRPARQRRICSSPGQRDGAGKKRKRRTLQEHLTTEADTGVGRGWEEAAPGSRSRTAFAREFLNSQNTTAP